MEYVLFFVTLALLSPHVLGYLIVHDDDSSSEDKNELGLKQRVKNLEDNLANLQESREHRNKCSDTHALKSCSDGWLQYNGSCYYFGRENIDFEKAKEFCKGHNAYLVHVETKTEGEFLKNFFKTFKDGDVGVHFWLGLTDTETEGIWRWYENGSKAVYLGWNGTEPQFGGSEDCAIFYAGYQFGWGVVPCDTPFRALCEHQFKST